MHRYFADPQPPVIAILDCVSAFTEAVNKSLKMGVNRGSCINITFRTDVFKFLFKDRGRDCPHGPGKFLELEDFNQDFFPAFW